jgi:hypothetical protein
MRDRGKEREGIMTHSCGRLDRGQWNFLPKGNPICAACLMEEGIPEGVATLLAEVVVDSRRYHPGMTDGDQAALKAAARETVELVLRAVRGDITRR